MKNTVLTAWLSLAIVAGGGSESLAASDKSHGKGPHHSFEELDANGDGKLMKEELEAHMQARFAGADTDGNGRLSEAELIARIEKRKPKRAEKYAAHMIERHDANGDGELSQDEMRSRHKGDMFAKMDENGDGAISPEEFKAMRGKHRGHGKGHKDHGQAD